MYAPNHQLHLIGHVEGLGLLGGEGAREVDGSKAEDDREKKKEPFCNTLRLHLLVVLQDKALDPLLKVDFTETGFL